MAFCPTKEKIYGYEDSRFEKDVDENFHCSICYNVLKEPRMCRNNEHIFCLACISEHLRVNSQTCPECNDHLSVHTLRRARLASNYLSKLKINCDHASRGCAELTCLEDLETHVANCDYAPVFCANAECGMVINKRERVHHETEMCQYRKVKCHDCGQIQEDMGTLKGSFIELDGKVEAANKEMKKSVGKLEGSLKKLDGKVDQIKQEVKKDVKDVKETVSKVSKDVDEVKVMMSQVLEKLNMLELLSKLPSPTEGMLKTPREDILIAGGGEIFSATSKSVEIYSWEKNGWFEVSPMNETHSGSSSFIYNDQLFVVGGMLSKTIETLNLNELPLKWMKCPGELLYDGFDYQTVVCQQHVIHIGGYCSDQLSTSNMISELHLTSPVTMEKLCQMPEPRDSHSVESFEDKVMILGGEDRDDHPLNSVLEFDVKKSECKVLPPLPHPVTRMATVRWRDQVVVLGGRDEDRQALNDVFMYDCKTGKTTALPSMLEKKYECCAVITGNTIVIMGGVNEKGETLNSVECFTMGDSTWEYLPAMNKARDGAVAEVLPSTRKYV